MWIKYIINIEVLLLVIYIFWIVVFDCSFFSIEGLQNLTMVMNSKGYFITWPYHFLLANQCNMTVKRTYRD
jgi:hypothetical protein